MTRILKYGGYVAAVVMIAFGVGAILAGVTGQSEVRDKLSQEKIVGSPDMKPGGIEGAVAESAPDCDVAGKAIDTGSEAQCFAGYMRVHALASTGGKTYAEMGSFLDENGNDTSDEAKAAKDPESGRPVENQARNLWVTETALSTALNTSFFAERVAMFSIIVGIALLLIGIGLIVLTRYALAPRLEESRVA